MFLSFQVYLYQSLLALFIHPFPLFTDHCLLLFITKAYSQLSFSFGPSTLVIYVAKWLVCSLIPRIKLSKGSSNGHGKYLCSCACSCCCCWILFHRQKLCQGMIGYMFCFISYIEQTLWSVNERNVMYYFIISKVQDVSHL